ncbi:response regulator transcription factor [Microlunatus panaciterrae]|uniref:DNA-binding response OmpR family regulator n=1 Tax=Microlunatus panaciterrae TaxID=400768 RepID=A0ABS2RIR2_9ACTN|nr:DNA-binding response OmpR family regulator [Microlunatus panaciterrae]
MDTVGRVAVIIEDDADIRNLLEAVLTQAGFEVHAVGTGPDGVEAVRRYRPIVTTLDISLPGIDGFEVARQIRRFSHTYLIMLSARTEEIDTLMGLDSGADDYLTKPFRPRELRARIEAMLRRPRGGLPPPDPAPRPDPPDPVSTTSPTRPTGRAESSASVPEDEGWLTHNGLRIHAEMRLTELDGKPLELTRSEFDLLLAIVQGRRRVVSKEELALLLRGEPGSGGYVSDADRRTVEVHLANLRRKLNDHVVSPRYLQTVRGVGYRLAMPRGQ